MLHPTCDCDPSRSQLILKIQEIGFALVDLNQFLDMHPNCQEAVTQYNCLFQEYWDVRTTYILRFGPLNNFGHCPAHYPFNWANDPWPWDRGGAH